MKPTPLSTRLLLLVFLSIPLAGCNYDWMEKSTLISPKSELLKKSKRAETPEPTKPTKPTKSTEPTKSPKGSVRSKIIYYAKLQGVPVCLALAVTAQESGFRCEAVGAAGELGPLQIKYASARMLGYRGGYKKLRNSCDTNILWGMNHLRLAYVRSGKDQWKTAFLHQQGPYAKSYRNKHARHYANSVTNLKSKHCS